VGKLSAEHWREKKKTLFGNGLRGGRKKLSNGGSYNGKKSLQEERETHQGPVLKRNH